MAVTKSSRVSKYLRWIWVQAVIISVMGFFTAVGTYLFITIEGKNWWSAVEDIWKWRQEVTHKLWIESHIPNMTQAIWRDRFLNQLMGAPAEQSNCCFVCAWTDEDHCEYPWTIDKGIRYSSSLYLTIGYGDIVTITRTGRVVSVIYACFGILIVVYVINIYGRLLSKWLQKTWTYLNRVYYTGVVYRSRAVKIPPAVLVHAFIWGLNAMTVSAGSRPEPWSTNVSKALRNRIQKAKEPGYKVEVPALIPLVIVVLYIYAGGLLIDRQMAIHDWTHIQSFYYLFNLLTTIGFGDLVLHNSIGVLFSHLYLFGGFALMTMLFDIIEQRLAQVRLPEMLRVREAEEEPEEVPERTWRDRTSDWANRWNPFKR